VKRQLDSKYKDLVEYVKRMRAGGKLRFIFDDLFESYGDINRIANNLGVDIADTGVYMDEFISIIVDIYNDNYEMEEPKYYVKMPKLDGFPWLTRDEDGDLNLYRDKDNEVKQTFTMSEIEAIDPRYKAFAVKVEDE